MDIIHDLNYVTGIYGRHNNVSATDVSNNLTVDATVAPNAAGEQSIERSR